MIHEGQKLYRSITVQNSSATVYEPQLDVSDIANIELIAKQMRAEYIHSARSTGKHRTSISSGVSRALITASELTRLWRNRSRSRRQLAGLNSRMLSDIGVTGLDARREARKWFWQA